MRPKEISEDFLMDTLSTRAYIIIKGARVNNLKNLSVAIPRNKLVVITGLSGSGKSSLAFDTLFAEGQRMYVESLSAYARQFLGRMEKPDVEYIRGISPAIAIEQIVTNRNPRSTVGTTTEIYDYFKLFFSRIGTTYSPISRQPVKQETVSDIVEAIHNEKKGMCIMITSPIQVLQDRTVEGELNLLLSKGFTRVLVDGQIQFIEELLSVVNTLPAKNKSKTLKKEIEVLIDRLTIDATDEDLDFRLSDSVQTAFFEGHGECFVYREGKSKLHFSDRFELDGVHFTKPSVIFFSFNNSFGACKICEGFGKIMGIDHDLVIPNKGLSIYEGAVAPWRTETMSWWQQEWLTKGLQRNFPIHRPYHDLTAQQINFLWNGDSDLQGINSFFKYIESKSQKIQYRVLLSRYHGRTDCPDCRGTRLRKDASYVKIHGLSITDLVLMPIEMVLDFFNNLPLSKFDLKVVERLLMEIKHRLTYLMTVGLGYLTLNRQTDTLSGGEFQRIKLATALGSTLVGSMYILDEPSIGLHPKDTEQMINVLKALRNLGNTVIVVEHDEEIMRAADEIIDIGPDAGQHGGQLVFQGTVADITKKINTHTTNYLSGNESISIPKKRRSWKNSITINGARENNLKDLTIQFPLGVLTVITGVSGSGKSTLVKKILYPALGRLTGLIIDGPGRYDKLSGDVSILSQIEYIDQNPIGKSSRSNPISYVKGYDLIRQFYADQPLSKQRKYTPSYFSFNVDGGRCENCNGDGKIKVEMQFMADIFLICEVCKGKKFKAEILEIKFNEKSIFDVLEMTVVESLLFFNNFRHITEKILPLHDVGLGYIKLGQSSDSLSGGEAQRVKLSTYLGKNSHKGHILFIFDEPTTGLHFHDIANLLKVINALVDNGHSVIIIEHNLEIIKCADWIIDLGPDGGDKNGGHVVFEGIPEAMLQSGRGYTAEFLKKKMTVDLLK